LRFGELGTENWRAWVKVYYARFNFLKQEKVLELFGVLRTAAQQMYSVRAIFLFYWKGVLFQTHSTEQVAVAHEIDPFATTKAAHVYSCC